MIKVKQKEVQPMKDKTLMECNLAMTKSCRLSDTENKEEALKIVENIHEIKQLFIVEEKVKTIWDQRDW